MPGLLILNHIFFLLQRKFFAKIIGHTINLCNFRLWKHSGNRLNVIIQHYKFNTFIAMFLIISEIYLFLLRTHVILLWTEGGWSIEINFLWYIQISYNLRKKYLLFHLID